MYTFSWRYQYDRNPCGHELERARLPFLRPSKMIQFAVVEYSRARLLHKANSWSDGEQSRIVPATSSIVPMDVASTELQQTQETHLDDTSQVTFWLQYQAEFGQRICVVGSCVGLGMWQHKAAPEMQWNQGHQWSVTVEVPAGQLLEYKYVILQPDGLTVSHWQSGNNAVLALMADDSHVEVFDNWYDSSSSAVAPAGHPRTTRSDRLALWATQLSGTVGQLRGELRATRMSVFEAQQGMKDALEQVKHTQDCLSDQVEENQRMAEQVVKMQEKNRSMRLQLIESQTLFKEVMAEARAIILSTVEQPDENSDDDLDVLDRSLHGVGSVLSSPPSPPQPPQAAPRGHNKEPTEGIHSATPATQVNTESFSAASPDRFQPSPFQAPTSNNEPGNGASKPSGSPGSNRTSYEETRNSSFSEFSALSDSAQQVIDANVAPEPAGNLPQSQEEPTIRRPEYPGSTSSDTLPDTRDPGRDRGPRGSTQNGWPPRRTSRRAPITMVPIPEPLEPGEQADARRLVDTQAPPDIDIQTSHNKDIQAANQDAAVAAASLKQVIHTKAVPATEAAGALLEAQVKLEAGLDASSTTEDIEWLTDQAESLLSVFEQLESDVNEAQEAVGRVMSTEA